MQRLARSLTFWVFIAAVFGALAASLFGSDEMLRAGDLHPFYGVVRLIKSSFLGLLLMLVAPITFFSLLDGIIGVGGRASVSRLGGVTILYFLATTVIAAIIAVGFTSAVHPWRDARTEALKTAGSERGAKVLETRAIKDRDARTTSILRKLFLNVFVNPFAALANRNILAIVFNAFLIGLAVLHFLPPENVIKDVVHSLNLVFQKILGWVILVVPLGVFAIVFDFTLSMRGSLFARLFEFAVVVFAATAIHGLVVLPMIAWFAGGVSPARLLRAIGKPMLVAMSTSSSAATLPVTMQTCHEELGLSPAATSFVCPLGVTVNMNGTAIFQVIAALFLADLWGVELGVEGTLTVMAVAVVSSIAAPGMPSGAMTLTQIVLLSVGIDLAAIGVLLIIERAMDTFRTAANVEGDIVGAVVIQRYLARKGALVKSGAIR